MNTPSRSLLAAGAAICLLSGCGGGAPTPGKGGKDVCLVGLWAYNPPAIISAAKDQGRLGKVKIVGFDEDPATLDAIKAGHVQGTIVQQPHEFGYMAVKLMSELVRDDKKGLPKSGMMPVPHLAVTKDGKPLTTGDGAKTEGAEVGAFHKRLNDLLSAKPEKDAGKGGARPAVAFVTNNPEAFWSIAEVGANKAAREFGVDLSFIKPPSGDSAAQKEKIDQVLEQGVKAVAISVIDPKNQTRYLQGISKRAILLTQDNDAPDSGRLCYIGTDNYAAGRAAGALVKQAMPEGGTVVVFVGQLEALNAQQRRQGLLDELSGRTNTPTADGSKIGDKYTLYKTFTDQPEGATKAKENAVQALTELAGDR